MYKSCPFYITKGGDLAAAIVVPLVLEIVIIGVVIGVVLWKRIKVAEFLYNLQLPKLTDLPQMVIRRWRPASSPPPELAVLALYPDLSTLPLLYSHILKGLGVMLILADGVVSIDGVLIHHTYLTKYFLSPESISSARSIIQHTMI